MNYITKKMHLNQKWEKMGEKRLKRPPDTYISLVVRNVVTAIEK